MRRPTKKSKKEEEEAPLPEVLLTPKEMHGRTYLKQIQVYCDHLGDHLLRAAVEHAITKGATLNPEDMLVEWELEMRIPLERHTTGLEAMSVDEQDKLFARMRAMNEALDRLK